MDVFHGFINIFMVKKKSLTLLNLELTQYPFIEYGYWVEARPHRRRFSTGAPSLAADQRWVPHTRIL